MTNSKKVLAFKLCRVVRISIPRPLNSTHIFILPPNTYYLSLPHFNLCLKLKFQLKLNFLISNCFVFNRLYSRPPHNSPGYAPTSLTKTSRIFPFNFTFVSSPTYIISTLIFSLPVYPISSHQHLLSLYCAWFPCRLVIWWDGLNRKWKRWAAVEVWWLLDWVRRWELAMRKKWLNLNEEWVEKGIFW